VVTRVGALTRMKKIKLSPLQNQILWILEEAGEETWQTVLVTLRAEDFTDEAEALAALDGLKRLGYVSEIDSAVILTERGHAHFTGDAANKARKH
jgi:Fe2+ or Zn2+ uptake regulation protein